MENEVGVGVPAQAFGSGWLHGWVVAFSGMLDCFVRPLGGGRGVSALRAPCMHFALGQGGERVAFVGLSTYAKGPDIVS